MKRVVLLFFALSLFRVVHAQHKAVTELGDEVILFEDGTWKYIDKLVSKKELVEIPINSKLFKKNDNSTFLLKSNKLNVGFWINPKLWSFTKKTKNPVAEYEFTFKKGDLYAMIISEKIEVPLETLKFIALDNGKKAAPDLKIIKEEYRNVNGLKVLLLQMNGTSQGIKFSYYGYYFSSSKGTVQFITYTSQNLIDSYKNESEELLNGLVELN